MSRLLYDDLNIAGSPPTLGGSLTSGGFTITFAGALSSWGSNIATISSPDYLPLVLDPLGDPNSSGTAEVVWLTAYTSGAPTGTIARGQEGSTGVAHNNAAPVMHGPTILDAFPSWFQHGSGSPAGSITPTQQGAVYEDLGNGGFYVAVGATSADWIGVGGRTDTTIVGMFLPETGSAYLLTPSGVAGSFTISDLVALAGTGNGLVWLAGAADGDQSFTIFLGSSGQFAWNFNADGSTVLPTTISTGRGITAGSLPTSSFSTTVGKQLDTTADRQACISPTLSTTVALSPDGTTYSTVAITLAAQPYQLLVPAGWYLKLTGDATYTVTYY